ncbi:YbjP/YqhG family protein [Telluribacter sp. SYSU D00476]|uniref:YbjP/YqhG family protein n=1 Tax=Telluribacter sp. SYSU D00476 TaxID=2811430 RepID=UPI001FF5B726|nr:YbjP/YqhG family protein [Telluribacter sp. SYSU D00476]
MHTHPKYPTRSATWLLILAVIISSCQTTSTTLSESQPPAEAPAQEGAAPLSTVSSLIGWLKNHPEQADERGCFTMDGVDVTDVDTVCIRQHIQSLRTTGLFASSYLHGLEEEYARMQQAIKQEGYAASKDYDRYFNSQDPPAYDAALTQLGAAAQIKVAGPEATVAVTFTEPSYTLTYRLRQEDGKWKIAHID